MRFFKKLFSIGSKKSKKRSAVDQSRPPVQDHLKPSPVDDTEAAVSRLLRSSSGRCAEGPPSSLPPLPHPIDSVIPAPKSSSTTIASVSARSTYSVTIHGRTVHSRTEFPNAYPPMDVSFSPKRSLTDSARRRSKSVPITPRDKNRLLALRLDPSVASLLHHYDDQGHLDSAIFSNTPSPQGVQRRRTGSTLRQLLGPGLTNSSTEGDISWAEKFLGETDSNSSVSSIGPRTPADTYFPHTLSIDDRPMLSTECDTSSIHQTTFSSLDVELSLSTDFEHSLALSSPYGNSTSSQRASQIFGFLGDKKRVHDTPVSRLPQLKTATPHYRRFSAESSISDTRYSHLLSRSSDTYIPRPTLSTSQRPLSFASDASRSPPSSPVFLPPQSENDEPNFPQRVITRYTGQGSRDLCDPLTPSKIPLRQSIGSLSVPCDVNDSSPYPVAEQPLSVLVDKEFVSSTAARPREMHSQIPKLRSASGSSNSSADSKHDPAISSPRRHPLCLQPGVQMKHYQTGAEPATGSAPHGKENDALSRLPQPITPARPFGLHSHHLRELPSPASSSELSPVGKQMMDNLRQQRMHARQRERQAGRLGSSQSRTRY